MKIVIEYHKVSYKLYRCSVAAVYPTFQLFPFSLVISADWNLSSADAFFSFTLLLSYVNQVFVCECHVYKILLNTRNRIHLCFLNDMECFFCVYAIFKTCLPIAIRKRITFLPDITKKLGQISCLVGICGITVKWTSFELLVLWA
jgi:hypothetical protein